MVKKSERIRLADLKSHQEPYVTIAELAEYWMISRKHIYKQIDAGTLRAIRLGPRLLRVRTADAIDFERRAKLQQPEANASKSATQSVGGRQRRRQ